MGPLPHRSFYSLPGGACASLVGSSAISQDVLLPPLFHYSLLGCVAATLIAILIITRVCRCHRSYSHFAECVFLCQGAPNNLQFHLLPNIVFSLVVMATELLTTVICLFLFIAITKEIHKVINTSHYWADSEIFGQ